MNKRMACIIISLVMWFSAVSALGENAGISSVESAGGSVELYFWAKNDSNAKQTAVYYRAISEFEALYPNVKINLRLYSDYGRIFSDVQASLAVGKAPNICITYPDHLVSFLSDSGAVLSLDDWMRDSRYGLGGTDVLFDGPTETEIVPEFLNECMLNGHCYAMPFMRSTEALYVNQDLVEKLGYELPDVLTWDFIWEVSEKAMEKNPDGTYKINGQDTMIPFIYKSTDNMLITMLKQLDAPFSTDAGDILVFSDVTKSLLQEIYAHARSRSFSTFAVSGYPSNYLNRGQCIFAVDSTAGSTWMGSDAPLQDIPHELLVHFRLALRPVPQYDPEHLQMISQGPSVCIFNKDNPDEVLYSWLFVQYLLTNDIQLAYAETEGYIPVTLKAQQSAEYLDYLARKGEDSADHYTVKIEAGELLIRHMSDTFVTPVFIGSGNLRAAAGQLVEETCKTARRGRDMGDADIEGLFQMVGILYQLQPAEQ